MCTKIPKLYSNGGFEDKTAIILLTKADITFINMGPTSDENTPTLEYGHWRFTGLRGVEEFVSRWKEKKLPPLDFFHD